MRLASSSDASKSEVQELRNCRTERARRLKKKY